MPEIEKEYSIKELKAMSLEELLLLTQSGNIITPEVLTIPLDSALDHKVINIAGNIVALLDATDSITNVNISFNNSTAPQINFTKGLKIVLPFNCFFITSEAQPGKTITLIISSFRSEEHTSELQSH